MQKPKIRFLVRAISEGKNHFFTSSLSAKQKQHFTHEKNPPSATMAGNKQYRSNQPKYSKTL